MKVKSAELQAAITIPGTKVGGATALMDGPKYPGLVLEVDYEKQVLLVTIRGKTVFTPLTNVKYALLFDEQPVQGVELKPRKASAQPSAN